MATVGSPFPGGIQPSVLEQAPLLGQLTGKGNTPWQPRSQSSSFCWSPDGAYFAWSAGDNNVYMLSWKQYKNDITGQKCQDVGDDDVTSAVSKITCGESVRSVALGESEKTPAAREGQRKWFRYKVITGVIMATGHASGRIRIWNIYTGELIMQLLDHRDVVRDLRFSPDGSLRLVSASQDGCAKVWELNDDGNMCKSFQNVSKWIYACAWSPDAIQICVVGDTRSAMLYESRKPYKPRRKLVGHNHDVCSCAFSPDGAILATGSSDTQVIMWDPHTGDTLAKLSHMHPPPSPIFAGGANGACIRGLSFSPDGRHLVSAAEDGYIRYWNVFDRGMPETIGDVTDPVTAGYSPDGAVVAVGDASGSVTLWRPPVDTSSLQHLCRMSIRFMTSSGNMDVLALPQLLQKYLQYSQE